MHFVKSIIYCDLKSPVYHKIEVAGAEQSSTALGRTALLAIDNNAHTFSETICSDDVSHWFRLKFTGMRCIREISIFQAYLTWFTEQRMWGTQVVLINSLTKEEHDCGIMTVQKRKGLA